MSNSEPRLIRWPLEWIKAIDAARGKQTFGDFVKECVREKIGKRKLSPAKRRGRPPSHP